MRCVFLGISLLLLALALAAPSPMLQAQDKKNVFLDPANAGPDFMTQGEYEGQIAGKEKLGAQVVARGNGKFTGFFFPGGLPGAGWDGKTKVKLDAKTEDKKTTVTGTAKGADGKNVTWSAVIADGKLTGKTAEGQEFALNRVMRKSPTLDAKPPSGAIVLFDGTSADKWQGGKLVEGNLLQMGVNSKDKFGDIKLHIEFRCPFEPFQGGQGRGNSGVYVNGQEVQVLDSFGLEANAGDCAALYSYRKPDVNMSYPPLSWQTYDIEYHLGKLDGDKKVGPKITVLHNGVKVHDNVEFKDFKDKPGILHLQNHGNQVYYKNIWVVELK
jgi:hypothetical protein